jgi:hypothetical protein
MNMGFLFKILLWGSQRNWPSVFCDICLAPKLSARDSDFIDFFLLSELFLCCVSTLEVSFPAESNINPEFSFFFNHQMVTSTNSLKYLLFLLTSLSHPRVFPSLSSHSSSLSLELDEVEEQISEQSLFDLNRLFSFHPTDFEITPLSLSHLFKTIVTFNSSSSSSSQTPPLPDHHIFSSPSISPSIPLNSSTMTSSTQSFVKRAPHQECLSPGLAREKLEWTRRQREKEIFWQQQQGQAKQGTVSDEVNSRLSGEQEGGLEGVVNKEGWKVVQVQNYGVNPIRRIKPKPGGSIRLVCISDTHSAHSGFFKPKEKVKLKLTRRQVQQRLEEELKRERGEEESAGSTGSAGSEQLSRKHYPKSNLVTVKEDKKNITGEQKDKEGRKEPKSESEETDVKVESLAGAGEGDGEGENERESWLPEGDVLLHTGDFSTCGTEKEVSDFCKFLDNVPHRFKIVIAGNHDISLEPNWYANNWRRFHPKPIPNMFGMEDDPHSVPSSSSTSTEFSPSTSGTTASQSSRRDGTGERLKEELRRHCIYLEDDLIELHLGQDLLPGANNPKVLRLYGTPWQPLYRDWAFNLPEQQEEQQQEEKSPFSSSQETTNSSEDFLTMSDISQAIPNSIDILLSHGPPQGCGSLERGRRNLVLGSTELAKAVSRVLPTLHIFGHIHEGYGVSVKKLPFPEQTEPWELEFGRKKTVTFVNACSVDSKVRLFNNPLVIDISPK